MKRINKMALAAIAATALAASAQAQYISGNNDLLLGFTTTASTGDLAIDLGSFSSLPSGVDLNTSGNTGFGSDAALKTALGQNGLSLNSLIWGVVGGNAGNAPASYNIYSTVAHGVAFPHLPAAGIPIAMGDVDTLGLSITSGRSAIVDPTLGNGNSVTEVMHNAGGSALLQTDWTDPTTTTSGTFSSGGTQYAVEDLYYQQKGQVGGTLEGTFTLGSDGSFVYNAVAVPEPATFGLLGGFGLLLLALRRQFARKAS